MLKGQRERLGIVPGTTGAGGAGGAGAILLVNIIMTNLRVLKKLTWDNWSRDRHNRCWRCWGRWSRGDCWSQGGAIDGWWWWGIGWVDLSRDRAGSALAVGCSGSGLARADDGARALFAVSF